MIEISIGVAIGVGVNLIVVPPLRDRQAAETVEALRKQVGEVLGQISEGFNNNWDEEQARECSDAVRDIRQNL